MSGGQLRDLVDDLRMKAARPPVHMSAHGPTHQPYLPDFVNTTHVHVKRGKPIPLGRQYDGPFPIVERLGRSCVKVKVGVTAGGAPRYEVQHWNNLKPAHMSGPTAEAIRPTVGHKPKLLPTTTDTTVVLNSAGAPSTCSRPVRNRRQPNYADS